MSPALDKKPGFFMSFSLTCLCKIIEFGLFRQVNKQAIFV